MLRRAAIVSAALIFASTVLATSVFRTTAPGFVFSQPVPQVGGVSTQEATPAKIEYYLPYPGILPDSPVWPLKALRDKIWLLVTRDPMRRAELALLFADKRVGMAQALVQGAKAEIGVSTATKAEKYLEQAFLEQERAQERGVDTGQFLEKLAKAALKHQEVLESLMTLVPEDARPILNQTIDYPKKVYEKSAQGLNEKGRPLPSIAPRLED